jgi:hypothetical protein
VLIPAALSPRLGDPGYTQILWMANYFGLFGLFPLLWRAEESLVKAAVFILYMGWSSREFKVEFRAGWIGNWEKAWIEMSGVVWCVGEWYTWTGRESFMPLMLYSVYCAVGLGYVFVRFCLLVFETEVSWIMGKRDMLGKVE